MAGITLPDISPTVTTVGAVADAVAATAETAGKGIDAAEAAKDRQGGVDAATAKGQSDALSDIELAKRAEAAGQATAGSPDAAWAQRVHDGFVRPE